MTSKHHKAYLPGEQLQKKSTNWLGLLLFLLLRTLLKVSPTADPLLPRILPILLVLSLPLASLQFLISLLLLSTLLLHLRLHLSSSSMLIINQHHLSFLSPIPSKLLRLQLFAINSPLVLSDKQHASICDGFVQTLPVLLIHEFGLRFLEAVEGIGCARVGRLVRMDQEGFGAVAFLNVGFWDAGLEVEHCVAIHLSV